jgi:hypothetical protein
MMPFMPPRYAGQVCSTPRRASGTGHCGEIAVDAHWAVARKRHISAQVVSAMAPSRAKKRSIGPMPLMWLSASSVSRYSGADRQTTRQVSVRRAAQCKARTAPIECPTTVSGPSSSSSSAAMASSASR